jgi:uncharacterized protein (DUF58 family)
VKKIFNSFYTNLFLSNRLFIALGCSVVFFLFSFFFPWLGILPELFFWTILATVLIDIFILYRINNGIFASRNSPERLSNGDDNELGINIESCYPFIVDIGIIDEIPFQFQKRDIWFKTRLTQHQAKLINYVLHPTKRGEFEFGKIRVYVKSQIGLIIRRYNFNKEKILPRRSV